MTIAVAAGYAVVSFVVSSLAPAVDWLRWPDKFSIFHYYNNPQIMQHGLHDSHIVILMAVIIGLTVVGWIGFMRRDVRTS
jgi:putative exporter of polyketide antibiotics